MSGRIVWLRALMVGSVGIGVAGLWSGAGLWLLGNRLGGAWIVLIGVLFCAQLLQKLRELARDERRRAAAGPPAA